VLINYKGFQLNIEGLTHLSPELLEELIFIFMRLQIIYVHSSDFINEQKPFRIYNTLEPKKPNFFMDYYCQMKA
jgi:hypothetical protein